MTIKIGDRVKLSQDGADRWCRGRDGGNPLNFAGTVFDIYKPGLPIAVNWDNGFGNSYDPEDLIVLIKR